MDGWNGFLLSLSYFVPTEPNSITYNFLKKGPNHKIMKRTSRVEKFHKPIPLVPTYDAKSKRGRSCVFVLSPFLKGKLKQLDLWACPHTVLFFFICFFFHIHLKVVMNKHVVWSLLFIPIRKESHCPLDLFPFLPFAFFPFIWFMTCSKVVWTLTKRKVASPTKSCSHKGCCDLWVVTSSCHGSCLIFYGNGF